LSADPRLSLVVAGYARGDALLQRALLDEFEPLLFGYMRSLLGPDPQIADVAARATHDLVVAFHLRLVAGALRLTDAASMRALAHRMSVVKAGALRAAGRPGLAFLADPESWSLAAAWPAPRSRLDALVDREQGLLLAAWLAGEPGALLPSALRGILVAEGILDPAPAPPQADSGGQGGVGKPPETHGAGGTELD